MPKDGPTTGFRVLAETVDTTTTSGHLVSHVFSVLAEFERPPTVKEVALLLADPTTDVQGVCDRFGVSKSTRYAYTGPESEVRRMPEE